MSAYALLSGEVIGSLVFLLFLAVLAVFVRRQVLARERLAEALAELEAKAHQLALAEELAGHGRLSLQYPGPRIRWTSEFCNIVGLPPGTAPSHEVIDRMFPQGTGALEATLYAHERDDRPFELEVEIAHPEAGDRVLRAKARNSFDENGQRDQVFLVLRDITEEYRVFTSMQAQCDAAVQKARQALVLASTDPLTGLANRRATMAAIDAQLVESRASGRRAALIVFDIDHFKQINDRHGHVVGDAVIQKVAEIAARLARAGDCVARVGGEEFVWLLADADDALVEGAAERLRLGVEAGTALAPLPEVTISVGWTLATPSDTTLSLFSRADDALLLAKRQGRNRVREAA